MYEDTEDPSDVHKDFLNCLALLHSTDDNSAEKLRKTLDAFIEKKYGFENTLTARMPKKFLQNTKFRGKPSNEKSEIPDNVFHETEIVKITADPTVVINNSIESHWTTVRVINADTEDYNEKCDIPRISIPDEESGDGLLCKICNGTKLGPLILLECQECQEVYHPLCHQPPVVDIDVYDPRIVWRCKKCIDSSSQTPSFIPATDCEKMTKIRFPNDGKTKEVKAESLVKSNGRLSKNDATPQTLFDCDAGQKATRDLSSNQSRKRIGSKLSVNRSITKQ